MIEHLIKAQEIVEKYQKLVQMTNDQVQDLIGSISEILENVEKEDYSDFEKILDLWLKNKIKGL